MYNVWDFDPCYSIRMLHELFGLSNNTLMNYIVEWLKQVLKEWVSWLIG